MIRLGLRNPGRRLRCAVGGTLVAALMVMFVPQNEGASDRDVLFDAVRMCGTFVTEQSVARFDAPPVKAVGGGQYYLRAITPEVAAFQIELTYLESEDACVGSLWHCQIKQKKGSRGTWKSLGLQEVFANATQIVPGLGAGKPSGNGFKYHDCMDRGAPVEYQFSAGDVGTLYVNVSFPALDANACNDVIRVRDLLFTCLYSFAAEPWAAYRRETGERHPPDRGAFTPERTLADVIEGKAVRAVNTTEVEVQTDVGTLTLLRTSGDRVQCSVAALVRDAGGVLVASDALQDASAMQEWIRDVASFYDGFHFEAQGEGFYTCAAFFPNIAILLRPIRLQNGDETYSLSMDAVDADAYKQHVERDMTRCKDRRTRESADV